MTTCPVIECGKDIDDMYYHQYTSTDIAGHWCARLKSSIVIGDPVVNTLIDVNIGLPSSGHV